MTIADAQSIEKSLAELEFPSTFSASIFFALFKTYGIPTISKLLITTGQLSKKETSSKRAADTGVILTQVVLNKPSDDRTIDGIARMNYLHDLYRNKGKISDADMLYTLSLFALEPLRWTDRYEWRKLTDMERCASGTFWKDLGDAMEIPYKELKSFETGWRDALHWLEELEDWSKAYEEGHMVPAATNKQLSARTLEHALFNLPSLLRPFGMQFMAALLEPRLRTAIMMDAPPIQYTLALHMALNIRKLFLRYFALPRPYFMRFRWFSDDCDPQTGRFHSVRYSTHPWYVKPTLSARWGLLAWRTRLLGGILPGDDGDKYLPGGYRIPEIGPKSLQNKGGMEMDETRARLRARNLHRCPFHQG